MTEKEFNNDTVPDGQVSSGTYPVKKKSFSSLWVVFLAFFGFVVIVFLTQRKDPISWVEDYQTAVEVAKKQDKPLLLAFYKLHTRFSTDMWNNTYNNPEVKKYVEANFVPVLIDVDKDPETARRFGANYYPAHYVKRPDSDKLFGPRLGYDPPGLFIKELGILLEKMRQAGE